MIGQQLQVVKVRILDGSRDDDGREFEYWHPWPYAKGSEEGYDEVENEIARWTAFLGHDDFMMVFETEDAT